MIERPDDPQTSMTEANNPEARARTGTEQIGAATYDSDETKTCDDCGEESPGSRFEQTGPTHYDNGVKVQICTLERCPKCGAFQ